MKLEDLPRTSLGFFPTPIIELPRLSALLRGPKIFMKRDDQSGVALGGNKVRKLEFLVADALSQGADTLVTGGAAQSNHCRQTAGAAAMAGMGCQLALGGEMPDRLSGNLLLNRFLGARMHWCGDNRKGETIPEICEQLKKRGKKPYIVPYGGSNAVGAAGFAAAVRELTLQLEESEISFSHIVFASSSGGTHAGLLVGSRLCEKDWQVLGICIDKEEFEGLSLDRYIVELAAKTASLVGLNEGNFEKELMLNKGYIGDGYGIVGNLEREALQLTANTEGILLDPVYTGRAMGGLIDMIRAGVFSPEDRILFWHTGGTPALFAYGDELLT